MSASNELSKTPIHQTQYASTQGEIRQWATEEAVGSSPMSAVYMDSWRSLSEYAKVIQNDELATAAFGIAALINRESEDRLLATAQANGGSLPEEIPGITPLHDVQDGDIQRAAAHFDLTDPNSHNYVNGDDMNQAHAHIMDVVNQELGRPPRPTEQ